MRKLWKTTALLLGLVTPALADEVALSRQYTACMENTGSAYNGIINCINLETERQDLRLNNAYKRLMNQLNPERKKALKKVQRTWIAFRDGNCQFQLDPKSRFPSELSARDCVLRTTALRASELESFISDSGS